MPQNHPLTSVCVLWQARVNSSPSFHLLTSLIPSLSFSNTDTHTPHIYTSPCYSTLTDHNDAGTLQEQISGSGWIMQQQKSRKREMHVFCLQPQITSINSREEQVSYWIQNWPSLLGYTHIQSTFLLNQVLPQHINASGKHLGDLRNNCTAWQSSPKTLRGLETQMCSLCHALVLDTIRCSWMPWPQEQLLSLKSSLWNTTINFVPSSCQCFCGYSPHLIPSLWNT